MRRMTLKYAKPGMVLGMPAYDIRGNQLLPLNTRLDDRSIALMTQNGVTEIFIEDARLDDVIVASMFSPELEGGLASAFRRVLAEIAGKGGVSRGSIEQAYLAVSSMAGNLSLDILGETNVSCCVSAASYIFLQPVKAAELAMGIGHKLRMPRNDLIILGAAAVLKDIGYFQKHPQAVAASGTPLSETPEHPVIGYNILKQHEWTAGAVAEAVLQHHEYWNGAGYPRKLKGDQICAHAQVLSIADTFSDLTADRPGRGRYMSHEAIEYIMAYSGEQFNPKLVEFVVRNIPSYPNGLTVQLNTGEIALVSDPKLGFIARPVVRICSDPEKGVLPHPHDIDLSKSEFQSRLIVKVLEYD